jgi:hypothetical protein
MTVQEIRKQFGDETDRIAFGEHDAFLGPVFHKAYTEWLEKKLLDFLSGDLR